MRQELFSAGASAAGILAVVDDVLEPCEGLSDF